MADKDKGKKGERPDKAAGAQKAAGGPKVKARKGGAQQIGS